MLTLTSDQIKIIKSAGISVDALEIFWRLFSESSFEAAVGSTVMLLKGQGQQRNERFGPLGEPSKEFVEASKLNESPTTPK